MNHSLSEGNAKALHQAKVLDHEAAEPSAHRIGEKIAILRSCKGYSQRDLDRMTGIHWTRVSRIESGHVDVKAKELRPLADALGVTVAQLLGEEKITIEI